MLRTFFMEDWLETHRNQVRYNLGESGHAPRSVQNILEMSGVSLNEAAKFFFNLLLKDSPNWGREDLREQVAAFHPEANAGNALITTGTSEALFLLFRYLQPKKVALIVPAFQLLYEIPESLGATIVPLKATWDTDGKVFAPWDEWMEILRTQKPDCVLWNHPHNPTGITFTQKQLCELHDVCDEVNATLIGDEHYRFLTDEKSSIENLGPTIYRNHPKTFVTGSFIKCSGTPGLRIGWCLGPHSVLALLQSEKNYTTHTVSPISEWLATVVLNDLNSPLWTQLRTQWMCNVGLLTQFFKRNMHIKGTQPMGGLVCSFGSQKETEDSFVKTIQKLLDNELFLLPLTSMEFKRWQLAAPPFLANGLGFRLGLGCEPSQFAKALDVLERTLI